MVKMCITDGHRYAGASGVAGPGQIVTVDEAEAKLLEAGGYAERVDALPVYQNEPEPEAAPERATKIETTTSRAARKRERAVERDK